ncbi:enoyl-CoA hydratase/isomerase family protein [Rhizobium leguminosarum]|uniref:enoyl-CoA hydratase/isomerase family protein n=1 Tax=Rhizobium leguminosarum TaxID=384 RepID=UPI001C95D356|nr:enoyl-CoA hydratase/isomerase family protein [Rhizobium leguminosarum]MBY5603682.1 enoyl-CoA hydratase/isomerase family protein [Rhizobium leguminosarum]MBY5699284.1 enoyl-CoA hydratase/isomerase family protein [Rhizobium leguminosarum]
MKLRPAPKTSAIAMSSKALTAAALLLLPALALSGQTKVAEKVGRPPALKAEAAQDHQQIKLEKRTAAYWRVTFDNPPFNIFGPETIPQMEKVVAEIESDPNLRVVVFDSDVPGFFLTHYNFTPPLAESTSLPSGPTGLHPLPDMLVRISKSPVVSIALIRGRATGVGSELALASDMRFASRQKAILSQWEVGAALVPGGGPMARLPRLMGRGRALEVLLGSDDINGDLAEEYGYVNRSFDDDKLDPFVDGLATRISGFDRQAIADTKRLVDFASLPSDPEIAAGWDAFITSVQRPAAQKSIGRLMDMGLQTNPDIEARLGHYTQTLADK